MSDSLLATLVKNDSDNRKRQETNTQLLQTIVANQQKILNVEEKRSRQEQRTKAKERRAKADNPLSKLLGSNDEQKKERKNLFERLFRMFKDIFGGLFSGGLGGFLGKLGLAGIIGGAVAAYFNSPEFKSFVDKQVAGLVDIIGNSLSKTFENFRKNLFPNLFPLNYQDKPSKGVPINRETVDKLRAQLKVDQKNAKTKEEKEFLKQAFENVQSIEDRMTYIARTRELLPKAQEKVNDLEEQLAEAELKGNKTNANRHRQNLAHAQKELDRLKKDEENIPAAENKIRELLKLRRPDGSMNVTFMLDRINTRRIADLLYDAAAEGKNIEDPKVLEEIKKNYKPLTMEDFGRKQRGGPVNVPGSGSGDKVPMLLAPGSFVMNRNAAALLQSGGLVPTLLEPGEKVFGPGQYGPMEQMLNETFSRFQSGGIVQASHPDTGSGYSVGKDYKGRPSIFTKAAAESFVKMMKDSNGIVKTSDITSSRRSQQKNMSLPGASPTSNHLKGTAVDIHGSSKAWIKANGHRYGWKNLVYSGHDGHFDYIAGGGVLPPDMSNDGREATADTDDKKGGGGIMGGFFGKIAAALGGSALSDLMAGANMILGPLAGAVTELFGSGMSAIAGSLDGMANGSSITGSGPVDMGADINEKLMNTAKLAMGAGFTKEEAKIMAAIAGGESSFNNRAHNPNRASGDNSYGLWQINMIDSMGPARRKQFGISSNEELFDPKVNARAAKAIYDSQGFGAWGAYKDGNAAKYMNAAQALKLQTGGYAATNKSYSDVMVSKSQEMFAKKIAENVTPVVVPMPMGGGGGGGTPVPGGVNTPFPDVPAEDTSLIAMEYRLKRVTWGDSV